MKQKTYKENLEEHLCAPVCLTKPDFCGHTPYIDT